MDSIKITPVPDDRLQRMIADPVQYFREANARAEKLIEDRRRERRKRQFGFTKNN